MNQVYILPEWRDCPLTSYLVSNTFISFVCIKSYTQTLCYSPSNPKFSSKLYKHFKENAIATKRTCSTTNSRSAQRAAQKSSSTVGPGFSPTSSNSAEHLSNTVLIYRYITFYTNDISSFSTNKNAIIAPFNTAYTYKQLHLLSIETGGIYRSSNFPSYIHVHVYYTLLLLIFIFFVCVKSTISYCGNDHYVEMVKVQKMACA